MGVRQRGLASRSLLREAGAESIELAEKFKPKREKIKKSIIRCRTLKMINSEGAYWGISVSLERGLPSEEAIELPICESGPSTPGRGSS